MTCSNGSFCHSGRSKRAPQVVARDGHRQVVSEQIGWCTVPADALLVAIGAARTAGARGQQMVAMVQTIEAIRMYGAAHDAKLPPSLDELPVPAPLESFTGKPLAYECHGDSAVLTGHPVPGLQYRLVLRFATEAKR